MNIDSIEKNNLAVVLMGSKDMGDIDVPLLLTANETQLLLSEGTESTLVRDILSNIKNESLATLVDIYRGQTTQSGLRGKALCLIMRMSTR